VNHTGLDGHLDAFCLEKFQQLLDGGFSEDKGVGCFGCVEIACDDDDIGGVEAGQVRQPADLP
jgi:hypothetical protein